MQSVLLLRLQRTGHRHRDGLVWLGCSGLGHRNLTAGGLRRGFGGPLGILIEIIDRLGRPLLIVGGFMFAVRMLSIFGFDVGEGVKRTRTGLLCTKLLGKLIVIGVGGQVLELSGYFLLFGFLTSAAHLTP